MILPQQRPFVFFLLANTLSIVIYYPLCHNVRASELIFGVGQYKIPFGSRVLVYLFISLGPNFLQNPQQ